MNARAASSSGLLAGIAVVGLAIIVALATDLAVTALSLAKVLFALAGLALLIPTIVLRDAKSYWLFLLVLSIPFDITKWLSIGMVDSQALVEEYGMPMSATIAIEVYVTDVVLAAMLLPWLARLCLRRETLYFPKIGYLFLAYLGWALIVSLLNAQSLYFSMFELFRQALYFLFFVYLINNAFTRAHFRSVVCALLLGLVIGSGTVIVFFERGIGTDTVAFASLHDDPTATSPSRTHTRSDSGSEELTVNADGGRHLGSVDQGGGLKRSQGIFRHPAIPASLSGLILPIVLAYMMRARSSLERLALFLVYALGFVALLLTFSRAGLIGFVAGCVAFIAVAGWSGLISRRLAARGAVVLTVAVVLSIPVLVVYLGTRPEAFFMRFNMFEAALKGYSEHPLLGVGLNNSTAAMKAGKQELADLGVLVPTAEPADSYYLALLVDVGPVGAALFLAFFGTIATTALRTVRTASAEMKPLMVGMIAGLAALATQSIADGPLAAHAVSSVLWLFVALIVVIARRPVETRSAGAPRETARDFGRAGRRASAGHYGV